MRPDHDFATKDLYAPFMKKKQKVIIVGGGFAGVAAARGLSGSPTYDVTLIDRRNYHLFQPLLYQVAMAGLNPSDISVPLRKLFADSPNVTVLMAEIDRLDLQNNRVHFEDRWLEFDKLILCCGAKHSYFGNNQWEEVAPGLKSIEQATEIRRRILMAFELAEKEEDPEERQKLLTFAVVGGGPTGVEIAGAIAEMVGKTLHKDFKRADLKQTRVILVEGGPRLLASFPESLSESTLKSLNKLGVEVRLNGRASNLTSEGLQVNGDWIAARTIVWAAGVRPSKLTDEIDAPKDRAGRVIVNQDLSVPGFPHVFVLGDQAAFLNDNGEPLPGLAPVALQQGKHLARSLKLEAQGKPRSAFRYFDKGVMATIGRNKAVVAIGKLRITGTLAWLIWVFVHVAFLMQFRNKVFVFTQWVWAYFSFGRGARLIVHKTWKFYSGEKIPIEAPHSRQPENP